jgi:hypothetical protein
LLALLWDRAMQRPRPRFEGHSDAIGNGETYKDKVKLTFAKGASLPDPAGLFNASLDAGTRRAIDLREDDEIDETAFKALIREAVVRNESQMR